MPGEGEDVLGLVLVGQEVGPVLGPESELPRRNQGLSVPDHGRGDVVLVRKGSHQIREGFAHHGRPLLHLHSDQQHPATGKRGHVGLRP